MNRKNFIKSLSIALCAILIIGLGILYFVFDVNVIIPAVITVLFIILLLVIYYSLDTLQAENNKLISEIVDKASMKALSLGNIGILVYSDDYQITWMSDYFINNDMNHVSEKILNWIPEIQDVLQGENEQKVISINSKTYEVNKFSNNNAIVFKDITNESKLQKKLNSDAYVIGLVACDNYDETQESEDDVAYVNMNIKLPVTEYFKKFNCVYKTLKNNRLLIIMNEEIYQKIYEDRFSILKQIRSVADDANLDVTLSMAFARGGNNLVELDDTAQELLELAQTRGGDQVVVRRIGEEVTFFGGTSEAREKLNKTKVRVNINSIKDLISKASNVIIVGHNNADADCIGAAICMSNIVLSENKQPYIVYKSNNVDPMIDEVISKYSDVINSKHKLVSESEALDVMNDKTLVIMVDHHSKLQSNGKNILDRANALIVLDHHRRKADLDINPLMFYCEASASSTCEIVCEFLPYTSKKLEIFEEEANIMYLGILIDTDRFRTRTGSRTFDVLKQLKHYGADPSKCSELAEEPYENIIAVSNIISAGKAYRKDVVISAVKNAEYNRTLISQACDAMVKAKDIEAAFVICKDDSDTVNMSARSNGKINVQVILEKMNGGGHMTAAGLQRKDSSVAKLENELLLVLDEYFKGDNKDESNIN